MLRLPPIRWSRKTIVGNYQPPQRPARLATTAFASQLSSPRNQSARLPPFSRAALPINAVALRPAIDQQSSLDRRRPQTARAFGRQVP